MSAQDNGGPAFPIIHPPVEGVTNGGVESYGLTLRDYFAAHAPAAPESWHGGNKGIDSAIEWRWSYADRMLKERQK